jgi:hypothetical protein
MLKIERWEIQTTKDLEAIKPKGLNSIAKIGYGHLCQRGENLSFNENPNFMQFSSEQNLIHLLNPTTTAHVKIVGFYIIKSLELRTEVS